MEIQLTTDVPVYYRPYRLSMAERQLVRGKIQTLLKSGVIQESESAYASPIVLIPKKNGEMRLCVDYRALNAITVKDRYPLPLISDQLGRLSNKRYFTTLDLAQGYHQVPMHSNSVHKTAFITPDGQYEYLRVPFGLANSPAVFQRIINKMLGDLRHDQVLAYMDDLLIPSCTEEQGLQLLETVLQLVHKAGVKLKLEKCAFLMEHIEYLGHEISVDGVRPGVRKIQAVIDFPTPSNVHGVRQFVGLASYFRKFVKNFSVVARPLTDLTKKNESWRWGTEQQLAFDSLKKSLSARPTLAAYDSKADTEVHTDASKWGLGGILMQKAGEPGSMWRPVEYFSRTTSTSEQVYHSYELETLAVVESIKRFRVYLVGVRFKVVTDCVAVRATMLKRDLVPRIARWWLAIQEYDFEVEYRAGNRMAHVDALSRNPCPMVTEAVGVPTDDVTGVTSNLVKEAKDPKAEALISALSTGVATADIKKDFRVKNSRLYRKTANGDRLYVPAMARFGVLQKHHDEIGHPGFERCLALLQETYWFPKMRRFVLKYTRSCLRCAFAKGKYGKGEGLLHPIERRPIPFDTVHIDHLGPFVRSIHGYSYILMLVDGFTKFVIAKPTKTLRSSEAISRLNEIFGEFGYPRRVISDRGLAFTSKAFAEYLAGHGVRHILNAIATPRANGQVERANRTIIQALAASASTEARWDERLPDIVYGVNHTLNSSTHFSPAHLMFSHSHGSVADLADGEQLASYTGADGAHPNGPGEKAMETEKIAMACHGEGDLQTSGDIRQEATPDSPAGQQRGDDLEATLQDKAALATDTTAAAATPTKELVAPASAKLQPNRAKAGANIQKSARRMKVQYNKKRKSATKYKVGDLVLWCKASTSRLDTGVNQKLANKFDGPFRVKKVLGHDRYLIESIQGVRGYKRFSATVAVDSLRPYPGVHDISGEDSTDED